MASTIKVTNIDTPDNTGNITVDRPLSGSGASLTSLPAANLTGTVADARISTLTASKLSGALPAISGASLTGISGGPFIRAYLNSTQSNLTNNVFTKVLLNGESYDTANEFDPSTNHRWTCGTAGKYLATANLTWDSGGIVQDKRHKVMIYKNGSQTSHNEIFTAQGSEFSMSVTDVYDMSATDYLEMYCWHLAGVDTPDIQAGAQTTWFAIARII